MARGISMATGKRVIDTIDGTPKKAMFRSIIADYGLRSGLCELVDNALDLWKLKKKKTKLRIDITLDTTRQLITVRDNAGGISESQLELLIAPGASRNQPEQELIGIFGVGGKRAGVALGELVEVRTRHGRGRTFQIDINNAWLATDEWQIEYYEVPSINQSSTIVDISKVRQSFTEDDVKEMRRHLGETYSWFIEEGCEINLNGQRVSAIRFDKWSYPPAYLPRKAEFSISPAEDRSVDVVIESGLIRDRDPERENYGVYVYCNDRLIVKELRTRDVGYFITAEAGVPHPDASLCRAIVRLHGSAELMPWTSSKSDVNIGHPSFTQLRSVLIPLVTYYSKLSRRLKNDWDGQVYAYPQGKVESIDPGEIEVGKKLVLPQLPRVRRISYIEDAKQRNRQIMSREPWTIGLVEAMGMADLAGRQKLKTKNRAALILLDSNFEIALKEFIVNRPLLFPPHVYTSTKITSLFARRSNVIKEVKPHVPGLSQELLGKVAYYYAMRNRLVHERASISVDDHDIADYRDVVEQILRMLFGLRFRKG